MRPGCCRWPAGARKSSGQRLSPEALRIAGVLEARGACFFNDLVRLLQGEGAFLKSQIEEALWELASAGMVTADGFDNLRALFDPQTPRRPGTRPYRPPAPQRRPLVAGERAAESAGAGTRPGRRGARRQVARNAPRTGPRRTRRNAARNSCCAAMACCRKRSWPAKVAR